MGIRTAFILLLGIACISPTAAEPFQPYSATYTVHADGFKVGEMKRSLRRRPNGTWTMESSLYTTGLVALFKQDKAVERSTWTQQGDRTVPLLYQYRYSGRAKEVVEKVDFDWQQGLVTSMRNGQEQVFPLETGMMDKLIYQEIMRDDLAEGARHLTYTLIDRGKIKTYEFKVLGEEKLVTSVGELNTLKVSRDETTFWVAPALDYLLVQIVQKKDHTLASYITEVEQPRSASVQ